MSSCPKKSPRIEESSTTLPTVVGRGFGKAALALNSHSVLPHLLRTEPLACKKKYSYLRTSINSH